MPLELVAELLLTKRHCALADGSIKSAPGGFNHLLLSNQFLKINFIESLHLINNKNVAKAVSVDALNALTEVQCHLVKDYIALL